MSTTPTPLSRREREIMDIIYARGQASAAEVREHLPDPPSYSAVRALLRILEEKGHLRHTQEGARYIYSPRKARAQAARAALERVINTFFENSAEKAVATLLEMKERDLSDEDLKRLGKMIEQARKEGR